jgi:transposase
MDAIFFVLRSGVSWSKLPKSLGPATTSRARAQYWTACGIMEEMLAAVLTAGTGWEHLHWDKLALVSSPTVAPVAGTEASQTDSAVQLPETRTPASCDDQSSVVHAGKPVEPITTRSVALPAT